MNIHSLFGNEAAENESIARLREYYFKSPIYSQITGDLALRILVGHKGIGKSALFKMAFFEDADKKTIPLWIKPDDILGLAADDKSILELIRSWKDGLVGLISRKILDSLGIDGPENKVNLLKATGTFINLVAETVTHYKNSIDLQPGKLKLVEKFTQHRKVVVYLDDLDRGWEGRKTDIRRISALLNAVRDLSSENPGLSFRIALRTDVYFLVRTSDESTDKIESSVIWYSWTNHEILALLVKRIETFFGREVSESQLLESEQRYIARALDSVMASRFNGRGNWDNIPMYRMLMSLIRKRPRDLVKLCTLAAREAYRDRSSIIETKHFERIFENYSQERVQDTVNEYRTELPDIERLILGMRPANRKRTTGESYHFSTDSLLKKIDTVILQGKFRFTSGKTAERKDLAQFLYKINFLTARKDLANGEIQRKYFEENRYLSSQFVDFGYSWEIHPAYRWALQPETLEDIFASLKVAQDS